MDIFGALAGKRTYIVAFLTALLGLLTAFDVTIPEWVAYILAAGGVTTMRMALPPAPGK
jgi:hypothetical protein